MLTVKHFTLHSPKVHMVEHHDASLNVGLTQCPYVVIHRGGEGGILRILQVVGRGGGDCSKPYSGEEEVASWGCAGGGGRRERVLHHKGHTSDS